MSRSTGIKILVFLLTAAALVVLAGSGAAAIFLGQAGLFYNTPQEMIQMQLYDISDPVANFAAFRYNAQKSGMEEELTVELAHSSSLYLGYYGYDDLLSGQVEYAIYSEDGKLLESTFKQLTTENVYTNIHSVSSRIPTLSFISKDSPKVYDHIGPTDSQEALTDSTAVTIPDATSVTAETAEWEVLYLSNGPEGEGFYQVHYYYGPEYSVEIRISSEYVTYYYDDFYWSLATVLYAHRETIMILIPVSFLLFVAGMVYLCWAAGWKRSTGEIEPVFFNRMPLDLYLALCVVVEFFAAGFAITLLDWSISSGGSIAWIPALLCLLICAMLVVLFLYAFTAQVKMKNGCWWRNSLIGRLLQLFGRGFRWIFQRLCTLIRLLPLIWQWILVATLMAFAFGFAVFAACNYAPVFLLFVLPVCTCIVLYGAYSFGVILRGARKMAQGDLHHQIPTQYLVGSFRDCAEDLNKLADVAVVAAQKQMKSERMKTELITNVSHDIKTPLTSIINFVDLLQKPHTEEEGTQYLEVLNRQSHRLKRLIEDLMDLSKASTGNMTVNITEMDAVEVVNQALGEFADKLEAVQLTPVFREPEIPAPILADGRLAWRVLSNLLSNAVKYALPGTRLYVDVVPLEGKVLISLKNISREQLSISAEELMERFVRGDASRNTEGSGLGLNIARSLMEVQHGQLQLLVDGDLFKVTLLFRSK